MTLQLIILIIESCNLFLTLVFLGLFTMRLVQIHGMGISNKYIDNHWAKRCIIACLYLLIGIAMLVVEIVSSALDSNSIWRSVLSSGSIGFCVNSLILFMHVLVLNYQLQREVRCSYLHQSFLIYLLAICVTRLTLSLMTYLKSENGQSFRLVLVCLSSVELVVSLIMLSYWFTKKKLMPTFDDLSKMDTSTITKRLHVGHQSINANANSSAEKNSSYFKNYSNAFSNNYGNVNTDKWNLIIPHVSVDKGDIIVILETLVDDDILQKVISEQLKSPNEIQSQSQNSYRSFSQIQIQQQRQSLSENPKKKGKNKNKNRIQNVSTSQGQPKPVVKQHLQTIAKRYFTRKQIQSLFLITERFEISSKIDFKGPMRVFYPQVQKYLQELFTIKQAYVQQIFQIFGIDRDSVKELNEKIYSQINSKQELFVSNFIDYNAAFLSIEVFKYLWVQDHFIFYLHTVTMDKHQQSTCYKRYTDFEDFHSKLQKLVEQQRKNTYLLPNLPKKHYFYSDLQQKGITRRNELEQYCRQIFNDYEIMTKMPICRQFIFEFLNLNKVIEVAPYSRRAIQFYDGLQIKKGNIYKTLIQEEDVTFYDFQLSKNNVKLRSIRKRFQQFVALHKNIQRWMLNNRIFYRVIVLPQKHLYKSQTKRHSDLQKYLQNIIHMNEVSKIYGVNKFFNTWQRYNNQQGSVGFNMSVIKRANSGASIDLREQEEKQLEKEGSSFFAQEIKQLGLEKQRMSLLIQQLGDQ